MILLVDNCTHELADIASLHVLANSAALREGITLPCMVELLLTDNEGIRLVNREHRGIDKPTDVLSFPSISYPAGTTAGNNEPLIRLEWQTEVAASCLGTIVISLECAHEQATRYGHGIKRELGYLLVHGLFHLFGYDHHNEEDKKVMRDHEEATMKGALPTAPDTQQLMKLAREAMQHAYAPYSGYRVGACLLSQDGRVFQGCNVENASYGLTNCGERTALFKAVSEGATQFQAIAIVADGFPPWPCGACRQVLSEFSPDMRVIVTWDGDHVEETLLSTLLPHGFTPASGVQAALGKEINAHE